MIMGGHKLTQEGCLVMSMEVLGAAAGVLHQPPPMYVFGDSYLDVGMNNYLPGTSVPRANKPYYGVDFPGFPTGRFSNGRNTADYIGRFNLLAYSIYSLCSPAALICLDLS
jgi:hypothetical protein